MEYTEAFALVPVCLNNNKIFDCRPGYLWINLFIFSTGKYVVFFFYPLDFSYVCPTEIIAFSDRVDDFNKVNCEIIAASTDSHFAHLAWYVMLLSFFWPIF